MRFSDGSFVRLPISRDANRSVYGRSALEPAVRSTGRIAAYTQVPSSSVFNG